jgi:hypothetical protein
LTVFTEPQKKEARKVFAQLVRDEVTAGHSRHEAVVKLSARFPTIHAATLAKPGQPLTKQQKAEAAAAFKTLVAALVAQGRNRLDAVARVAEKFPAIHAAYLAQTHRQYGRADCRA